MMHYRDRLQWKCYQYFIYKCSLCPKSLSHLMFSMSVVPKLGVSMWSQVEKYDKITKYLKLKFTNKLFTFVVGRNCFFYIVIYINYIIIFNITLLTLTYYCVILSCLYIIAVNCQWEVCVYCIYCTFGMTLYTLIY